MTIKRDKFDFEVGCLVKSPCKSCDKKRNFPKCLEKCETLNEIQTLLASGISCSRSFSATEPFLIGNPGSQRR